MVTATMPAGRVSMSNGNGHAAKGTSKKSEQEVTKLPALEIRDFTIQIVGTTPLIVHAFSEKGRKAIEEKQQKKAKAAKAARDPEEEYRGCFYLMPGSGPAGTKTARYGIPAAGFKKGAISACRYTDGLTMTKANGAFFVLDDGGGLVEIEASDPVMRVDTVRIGPNKVLDMRYRPEFAEWKCNLRIRYNAANLSAEQIVNLFHHAGFHVGYGEMRPEKGGYSYGMFEVRTAAPEKKTRKRK